MGPSRVPLVVPMMDPDVSHSSRLFRPLRTITVFSSFLDFHDVGHFKDSRPLILRMPLSFSSSDGSEWSPLGRTYLASVSQKQCPVLLITPGHGTHCKLSIGSPDFSIVQLPLFPGRFMFFLRGKTFRDYANSPFPIRFSIYLYQCGLMNSNFH